MNKLLGLRIGGQGELFLDIKPTDNFVGSTEDKWCNISLEIKNKHLELSTGGEILSTYEIKEVIDGLEKILTDKIKDTFVLETTEPYLVFIFNKDHLLIKIMFDSSKDYYCTYIDKYNIKKIYDYLLNILKTQ